MADDPQAPETAPESPVAASEPPPPPEGRGTREERRAARDEAVRAERTRTELAETAARADALSARVAAMQKAEFNRRAEGLFHTPGDLDLVVSPEEIAACWDDDGQLDEGSLAAVFDKVLDERPGWRRTAPVTSRDMDIGRRGVETRGPAVRSWQGFLRGD